MSLYGIMFGCGSSGIGSATDPDPDANPDRDISDMSVIRSVISDMSGIRSVYRSRVACVEND